MACMGLSVHAATRPPMPRDTPASISIFPSRPTPRRAAVRHCSTPARRSSLHMRHRQPQLSPSTHSPSHAWCPPPFARGLTTFNQRLRSRHCSHARRPPMHGVNQRPPSRHPALTLNQRPPSRHPPMLVSTTLQPTAPLAPHRSHGACATSRHPAPCCCESLFAASCASSLHTYTPATSTHSHHHLSTHPTLRSVGLTTVHLQARLLATAAHTVRTLAYYNSAFQTHAPLVLCVVCRGGYSPQGEN